MRLNRLNLTRYGKFTDFSLDFGPRETGKPDFHVVFGLNEAGKTTVLSAYLDLLFGIDKSSGYKFLHGYDTMQVGGVLEFASVAREFVRVKKSLLDAKGQIVLESAIAGELSGLSRSDYKLKFSLDAETLEKGGDAILASKGDLGELLFQASAGVADLSQKLHGMREATENFFKKGAHKNELGDLKKKIKDLENRKQEIDTLASIYAKFLLDRKEAINLYKKAMDERTAALAAKSKIERIEGALPRFETLNRIIDQLKSFANVPEAPAGWKEKISQLQTQEIQLAADLKAAMRTIENLTGEIEGIAVDETALRFADRLGDLTDKRARHVAAEEDIPRRRPEVLELNFEIAAALRMLGREGEEQPDGLILEARATSALRALIESWGSVETGLKAAEKEVGEAQEKLGDETDKLNDAQSKAGVDDPEALAILGKVVAEIRKAAFESRRDQAVKASMRFREHLDDKLKPLVPWRGEADDLVALRVPEAAQIERWKTAIEDADKGVEGYADDMESLRTELSGLRAQRDGFAATAGIVSDNEAAQKRSEREAAWADHRRSLSPETADAFESRLRADDLATAARFNHVTEIAKVNATLQSLTLKEKELERTEQLWAEAGKKFDAVRTEFSAAIKVVSPVFPDGMTASEFSGWANLYDKAIEARDHFKDGESELREAESNLSAAIEKLGKVMGKAGIAHDPAEGLETMILLTQSALDEATAINAQREAVDSAKRNLGKRQSELKKAQEKIDDWLAKWKAACTSCWIAETHPEPSIPLVREILAKIEAMRPSLSKRAGIKDRIRKMEEHQTAFAEAVATLAADMDEEIDGRPLLVIADRLADRVKNAREQNLIRKGKQNDLKKASDCEANCREKIVESVVQKKEIFDHLEVETLAAAGEKLDEAKAKADLLKRKAEEEGHILKALGVATMEKAEMILKVIDPAKMSSDKAAAENQFNEADAKQRDFFLAKSKAEEKIETIGGDDAVALIDERRRTVCLEIEDRARDWLRMRSGVIAAERALRVYREKHRSSMLANASEAFSTISRGAYKKLTTQSEGDGEVLVGIASDGKSKKAPELSKGTRFQLYLALRVAGYQEYALSRQPPSAVPFVADDIMETFDDFRAEEAFRLLAKMSEVGQVIYLTHHEHLCGIAQKICPDVRIHNL
jgi:uncharacterized protein YhaN